MNVIMEAVMVMRAATFVLIVSLIGNLFLGFALFLSWDTSGPLVPGQADLLPAPEVVPVEQGSPANTSCRYCETLLEYYRGRLNGIGGEGNTGPGQTYEYAELQAPAVMTTVMYERRGPFMYRNLVENGTMMNISVEILPGQGRVLVHTTPLMGVVFQDAANTAVSLAENRTRTNLSGSDVIFSIEAGSEIPEVDGPSAGALMAVLAEAAITHRGPDQGVTLTGTIDGNGHVGPIGGVIEKAQAARDAGKGLILLPEENSRIVRLSSLSRNDGGFSFVRQMPEELDAKEFIEKTIGIRVEYVSDIGDLERKILGSEITQAG